MAADHIRPPFRPQLIRRNSRQKAPRAFDIAAPTFANPAMSTLMIQGETLPMSMRMRKLVGAFGLLALVTIWTLLAMMIAQPVMRVAHGLLVTLYFIAAGLGWILPAMPLIRWMSRPDPER